MVYKLCFLLSAIALLLPAHANITSCHPKLEENKTHYVIGYGSLMNKKSRERTNPDVKYVYPLMVNNFQRIWGTNNGSFKARFLTARPMQGKHFNGVYYSATVDDIYETDTREISYCRITVKFNDLNPIGLKSLPKGIYWIYTQNPPSKIFLPNKEYPIIQSYVDVFINGCIDLEYTYRAQNFAKQCIETTDGWNEKFWINDRVNARRPTDTTPNILLIDRLLSNIFPDYYNHKIGN